jgi:hypothetical protein
VLSLIAHTVEDQAVQRRRSLTPTTRRAAPTRALALPRAALA